MDSLNLNCLKQDPTTIGTCGRLISSLYCISTFAINIYNIWPIPVHDTLLHHIDLYFIRCNQCQLHTAPQLVGQCLSLEVNLHKLCRVRLNIHIVVIQFPDAPHRIDQRKRVKPQTVNTPMVKTPVTILHVRSKHPLQNYCYTCDTMQNYCYTCNTMQNLTSLLLFPSVSYWQCVLII